MADMKEKIGRGLDTPCPKEIEGGEGCSFDDIAEKFRQMIATSTQGVFAALRDHDYQAVAQAQDMVHNLTNDVCYQLGMVSKVDVNETHNANCKTIDRYANSSGLERLTRKAVD